MIRLSILCYLNISSEIIYIQSFNFHKIITFIDIHYTSFNTCEKYILILIEIYSRITIPVRPPSKSNSYQKYID